jgi:transposase-like protein
MIQEILEKEVLDVLGRRSDERRKAGQEGYRNGYERKRIKSGEGMIEVYAPQVRDRREPYRSQFLGQLPAMSEKLKELVLEMYARGLSTRDIEDALREDGKLLLSKSAVSELTDALWEEYRAFSKRDLSGYDVVYMFADAVYESLRNEAGFKEGVLVVWGICADGRKALLHMTLGNKESEAAWTECFRDMIRRGLRQPLVITRDGAPGLVAAIDQCFPQSVSQPCLAHKVRNVAATLPESTQDEVMGQIKAAYYHTDPAVAKTLAQGIIERYAGLYPSAIDCFQKDFDECVQYMQFPIGHHKFIRTTNLLERSFLEQKRRTHTIPKFFDEKSCLKLVYAVLIRVSERWQRVKMTDWDLTLLKQLRKLKGWNDEGGWISRKIAA